LNHLKRIPLFHILCALAALGVGLAACAPAIGNPTDIALSKPTEVATKVAPATPTQPPTPEPTPTPESPQQKMERVAREAVKAGATANAPDTWAGTALEEYRTTFENASNPDIATDAKLDELDAMLTVVRRADMEQFLAAQPDAATAVLAAFARSGLMKGGPAEADVTAMTPEQLQEFNARLSSHDRRLLEVVRRAMAKENIVLSPVEIISMETDINGLVPYAVNVKRGVLIDGAPGYYGMWVNHSDEFPDDMSTLRPYAIPMFGRTTVHGKDIIRRDILTSDTIRGDVVGIARLPQGKTGVVMLLKDFDGTPYLHTYEVALNPDQPVVIPSGSTVLGIDSTNHSGVFTTTRDVALITRYAVDKDAYNEFVMQLTPEILNNWLAWPPFMVKIYTGYVPMRPAGLVSQFFDPDNGLVVIGSEVDGLRMGYLFFGTDAHNPWP